MNEGDVILLDFEGWTGEPPELFDTTKEELAKEHDIHEEKRSYGPMVALVGGGRLVEGLEEHLKEAKVEQDYEVTVQAEKAYGAKDPKQIKLHRRQEIERQLRDQAERNRQQPMPLMLGVEVELDGQVGHVVMVSGSRVRVDFNHHLAGKDLTFKYRVTESATEPAEKVAKLIKLEYPVEAEFDVDVDDQNVARITVADICKYDANWFGAKMRVVASLRKWAEVTDVHFIESYVAPPPTAESQDETEATKAETAETAEPMALEADAGTAQTQKEGTGITADDGADEVVPAAEATAK